MVIPVYNGERFLRETLASVFQQTRIPKEIVVVDDCSTDGSVTAVHEMTVTAPCAVRLIELTENSGGPARPMNVGIDAACGDWISLLDQDDLMLPDKLSVQGDVLRRFAEVDLVLSDYESFRDGQTLAESNAKHWFPQAYSQLRQTTGVLEVVPAVRMLIALITECGLAYSCTNYVFRKSLWTRACGFDPAAGQCSDYDFLMRAIDRPVAWIDRVLARKRIHEANLWHSSVTNCYHILHSQRMCARRYRNEKGVRLAVKKQTRAMSQVLRWRQEYAAAIRVAIQLAKLGDLVPGVVEAGKTILAMMRDTVLQHGRTAVGSESDGM